LKEAVSLNRMSQDDWFRRSTWTDYDRDEFNARLKRSRGAGNKAQYLRLQAGHLAEAGLHAAAIELLDRMFTEFPAKIHIGQAHLQKAESLAFLGQTELAISEFRAALQAERDFPNVRSQAWLEFGWFVVQGQLTDLYDEALHVLEEFRDESGLTFPVIEFRHWAIRSLIADSRGDGAGAREFARRALVGASKEHSGLRYHARLGLVGPQPKQVKKKLKALRRQLRKRCQVKLAKE
jgi:tetratricopeptide (TPR) repeat protein